MITRRTLFLYFVTIALIIVIFIGMALWAKQNQSVSKIKASSVETLMAALPEMDVTEREKDNQMLTHNVALFNRHPEPETITSGYVGTSRTRVLRPEYFGVTSTVVGAGNSYNEITFGLLLQAEILRLEFPNLEKVYFEASMLLRRPARLIVEEDHRKYFLLLESLESSCLELSDNAQCRKVYDSLKTKQVQKEKSLYSALIDQRESFRFTKLFEDEQEKLTILGSPFLKTLKANGERKGLSRALVYKDDWKPEILKGHIKVQRLRDIMSNSPWDGLFDLIAAWGGKQNIQVAFFQPPVRSDLYSFQLEFGLKEHVADIERISRAYKVPFINLNHPKLGYMNDWSIFSDEDHMETCIGSGLLTLALEEGFRLFQMKHELFPNVDRSELQDKYAEKFKACK